MQVLHKILLEYKATNTLEYIPKPSLFTQLQGRSLIPVYEMRVKFTRVMGLITKALREMNDVDRFKKKHVHTYMYTEEM